MAPAVITRQFLYDNFLSKGRRAADMARFLYDGPSWHWAADALLEMMGADDLNASGAAWDLAYHALHPDDPNWERQRGMQSMATADMTPELFASAEKQAEDLLQPQMGHYAAGILASRVVPLPDPVFKNACERARTRGSTTSTAGIAQRMVAGILTPAQRREAAERVGWPQLLGQRGAWPDMRYERNRSSFKMTPEEARQAWDQIHEKSKLPLPQDADEMLRDEAGNAISNLLTAAPHELPKEAFEELMAGLHPAQNRPLFRNTGHLRELAVRWSPYREHHDKVLLDAVQDRNAYEHEHGRGSYDWRMARNLTGLVQWNTDLDPDFLNALLDNGFHTLVAVRGGKNRIEDTPGLRDRLVSHVLAHNDHETAKALIDNEIPTEDEVEKFAESMPNVRRHLAENVEGYGWVNPDAIAEHKVAVAFGTNKLRQARDHILATGKKELSPKQMLPGDWKVGRLPNGNISADLLQQAIDSAPRIPYNVTHDTWDGAQRHSDDSSRVFQLNITRDQVRQLKEAGVYDRFRKMHEASRQSGHPLGPTGIGWVRWTGGKRDGGIFIDEVQSDFGQSFIRQMANQARERGEDENEWANHAEKEYGTEDEFETVKNILFGGKHPSEVLQEAFHEWLRTPHKPAHFEAMETDARCPECKELAVGECYCGKQWSKDAYPGLVDYRGTPIHIWQPESKATISLGNPEGKLPGHFYVGYRDVPQKKMGFKPAVYGELETQTNERYKKKTDRGGPSYTKECPHCGKMAFVSGSENPHGIGICMHCRGEVPVPGATKSGEYVSFQTGHATWKDEVRKNEDQRAQRPQHTFQEHALPAQLHAEGFRLNIAHMPGTAIATVHQGGRLVGHMELLDTDVREEWKHEPRAGLRETVRRILEGHSKGQQEPDAWNEAQPGPVQLRKDEFLPAREVERLVNDIHVDEDGFGAGGDGAEWPAIREHSDWALTHVPTGELPKVGPDTVGNPSKLDSYAQMPASSSPPVVLVPGQGAARWTPVDGWHRIGAAQKRGDATVLAYVPKPFAKDETQGGTLRPQSPPGFHAQPTGSHVTQAHRTYSEAAQAHPKADATAAQKNIWVRPHHEASNAGRTLMVQFSSDLLQGNRQKDHADAYYDNLYSKRQGYHRPDDWWEVPQWQAHIAHSLPHTDHYTVRDPEEAKRFIAAAGYKNVAFSSLDVTAPFIKDLAKAVPQQAIAVGGYTDMDMYREHPNVTVHPSVQSFVESEGHDYRAGYDYRHFNGVKVIPRLTLSDGCRHQCTFCCVPKKVTEVPLDTVRQQADAFGKDLDAELVYLNDKTFGQAENHAALPELYQRIKRQNPNFKGFVIQTTAAQMKRMTPEFLRAAGIRHVELGIESVNDPILRAHKKPANEAIIEEAAQKIRAAGSSLIPNIMVGLPGEDEGTYGRTMDWLKRNADIISHVNAYNLALYEDSELGKTLQAVSQADRDENQAVKSWMTDPAVHKNFSEKLFQFANEQLDKPVGHVEERPFVKRDLDPSEGYTFRHKAVSYGSDGMGYRIDAHDRDGNAVGYADLTPSDGGMGLASAMTEVLPEHRRKGIASAMYAHAEKVSGQTVYPSTAQTRDGRALWQGTLGMRPEQRRFGPYKAMAKTEDPHPARAASVLVYNEDGQVLWGRRQRDGKWTLPGGHLEPGEDPATGAVRELFEEAGLVPERMHHFGSANTPSGIPVYMFQAEVADQAPHARFDPDNEVSEWRWVDCLQGLPPDIASNLAHPRNVVCEHMGWTAPVAPAMMTDMAKSELMKSTRAGLDVLDRLRETAQENETPFMTSLYDQDSGPAGSGRRPPIPWHEPGHDDAGAPDEWFRSFRTAPITMNFPAKAIPGMLRSKMMVNAEDKATKQMQREADAWDDRERDIAENGWDPDEHGDFAFDEFAKPYLSRRREWEEKVLGIPADAPGAVRPVYGALHYQHQDPEAGPHGAAPDYGELFMKLKPEVRQRSSFTSGDSFGNDKSRVFLDDTIHHVASIHYPLHQDSGGRRAPYVEAQIHGGVSLGNDVESVHITPTVPAEDAKTRASAVRLGKQFNLPVYHHHKTGEVEQLHAPAITRRTEMSRVGGPRGYSTNVWE